MNDGERDDRSILEKLQGVVFSDHSVVRFVRDFVTSAFVVVLIGALLFGISGVWPPMVAVESGSMEPHMQRGDLVFVMDEQRLIPNYAVEGTGVVTHDRASDPNYRKFGDLGDVIVFQPDGNARIPVIHRAHLWVNEGENWYARADQRFVSGSSCSTVPNCPAPHAGFITKGDANPMYDQVSGISGPVHPTWIKGTAEIRVPWLGYVRLYFSTVVVNDPQNRLLSGSPI